MKKTFLALMIMSCMVTTFIGCKPELKNVRGQVKSLTIDNDTVKSMVLSVDGQEKKVSLIETRFQNGLALVGDSVILDYIDGKEGNLRALVVTVLPKPAKEFEPSDSVVTFETETLADSIQ